VRADLAALEGTDITSFLNLLYQITRNPSFFVAIPILHCWTKLLKSNALPENLTTQIIIPLLEICCARLMRYEAFPEDSEDPTILFLNEDVDTVPERHAFLGNFRRYCSEVIETAVRKIPMEAMSDILSKASSMFDNLYRDQPPFNRMCRDTGDWPVLTLRSPNLLEDLDARPQRRCIRRHR
jgi:exportin-5